MLQHPPTTFCRKENMFYTYLWLRGDGTPYYVGKGSGKRAFKNGGRPARRPESRARIILQYWESEEKAFEMEKWWILFWGRKDNGTGILRNLSDGGEGSSNLSEQTRLKMGQSHVGKKHSEETKEKMRIAATGRHLGNTFHLGKKHSEETKALFRKQRRKGVKRGPRNLLDATREKLSLRMLGNTFGRKRKEG